MKIRFLESYNGKIRIAVFFLLSALMLITPDVSPAQSAPDKVPALLPRPTVRSADKSDLSPPLRSIKPILTGQKTKSVDDRGASPVNDTRHEPDPVIQNTTGEGVFNRDSAPPIGVSFEGISNNNGYNPPDPNGDIGPKHYVQMVNAQFQIFTRLGASAYGPANINTLFAGFGGACEEENAGEPIVLYDQLADRWLLSQITAAGPTYFKCIAVSTTSDPTGSYYRYAFGTGFFFPDSPKYGVGANAYFISTREFGAGEFAGLGVYALNRAQMLAGNPFPQVVSFMLLPESEPFRLGDGLLPADLDGTRLPPPNSPHYFVGSMDNGGPYGAPADALNLFKFRIDWAMPGNSTFTFSNQLNTAAFDSIFPCAPTFRDCIPQPETTAKLDILSYRQRPTYRLAYRNHGTHESLVTSQSVEANGGLAGMRWWEIRSPNSNPVIFQEGTYAPADAVNRWMGSVAMDNQGNMALGYSVSNGLNVFPGIRYTGRLASDPLGTMPQGEGTIINGSGSQTGGSRWGDYSSMSVDPEDDCTFWYTNEYYAQTSPNKWQTRIGSFKFPDCVRPAPAARASISGRIVSKTGRGLAGVRVTITGGNLTEPRYAQTNAFGFYRFVDLPVGEIYTLAAKSKNRTFVPPVRVITLSDNLDDVNFVGNF